MRATGKEKKLPVRRVVCSKPVYRYTDFLVVLPLLSFDRELKNQTFKVSSKTQHSPGFAQVSLSGKIRRTEIH